MWNLENGNRSDISDVLHGEPYAGKRHVTPLLCYGATGRFDEVRLPKTAMSVLRVDENRADEPDEGRPALLYSTLLYSTLHGSPTVLITL